MKKNRLLLVLAINALTIHAQNLMTNPGFETWSSGFPTGWSVSNSSNLYQSTTTKQEGASACGVNSQNSGTDISLSQSIPVTPGKTYTLRLSYYVVNGDGTDVKILSYFRNSSDAAIKMSTEDSLALKGPGGNSAYFTSSTGNWNTYTCDVVAPAGATTFLFNVKSAGYSNTIWDNFYFGENTKPTVYTNKKSLSGFTYTPGNGPSAEQSFTVKGYNLSGSVTVTAPANFEISAMSGADFAGTCSLTIARTGTQLSTLPIYVRLKSGLPKKTYTGNITISSPGATAITIPLSGSVADLPVTISTSTTSLTGFSYIETKGPSAQKSFLVSGSGLTSDIIVAATENFEMSLSSGNSFVGSNTLTLAQSAGSVAPTIIYVRMKSGLTEASYTGNISLTTTKASQNIALSGKVTSVPGVTATPKSLTGFSYHEKNGPSQELSFTVSGTGLTSFLIITAPAEFEISTDSGSNFSGTNQLLIPQSAGVITETPIYVRLKSDLTANSYSGNITISTSGNPTQTISLEGEVLISSDVARLDETALRVFSGNGIIAVEGTAKNETVALYTTTGLCLKSIVSDGNRISIDTKPDTIYLLRIGTKTIKVIL